MPKFRRKAIDKEYVEQTVHELLKMRSETDPAAEQSSANDKHQRALMSAQIGSRLFGDLCGWAIEHIVASEMVTFMELTDGGTAPLDEDFRTHELEEIGAHYGKYKSEERRLMAVYALKALTHSGGLVGHLSSELSEALMALEYGQTEPLLKRKITGKQGAAYWLMRAKLGALKHVEFRIGKGATKSAAQEEVADAFGQSFETIRSWEKRHVQEFRATFGVDCLEDARNCGEYYRWYSEGTRESDGPDTRYANLLALLMRAELEFSDQRLRMDGDKFQELLRTDVAAT